MGLAVAVLGMAAIRVRLLDVPLERDEGEYAYIAGLLLDGIPPYAGAYTMKLPGTPVMYALAMAIFGRTVTGIHVGLLLASGATAVLLFLLARRLLGSVGALAAIIAFACLSVAPKWLGTHAHASTSSTSPPSLGCSRWRPLSMPCGRHGSSPPGRSWVPRS